MIDFEWDEKKAAANAKKHGVTFQEAASVFGDRLAVTFSDPDHSKNELRFLTFGMSISKQLLLVSYTDRGNHIRLISARPMTRREKKIYEEG